MKLPDSAHTSRPWRIHDFTPEFELEDVWALPTPGGPDDFPRLLDLMMSFDPSKSSSLTVRTLFEIRWKLGGMLGFDDPDTGLGARVSTLAGRLPAELGATTSGSEFGSLPFTPLYVLEDEFAAEIANKTVHGVLHVGWVPDAAGGFRGQMAVLVKPNGLLGKGYMAVIKPFRYLLVYPQMLREIGRTWRESGQIRVS